jgi:hypothetical protein
VLVARQEGRRQGHEEQFDRTGAARGFSARQ